MSVTIKDVARKAQVSVATVSLVINNNQRISPETKRKVLRAIKALDYHPTRSARGLVSKRSGNIGFILTDDHFSRSEPFYTKIFLGTEFEAREEEYYVLLTTISSTYHAQSLLPRFILEKNVDGIILAGKIPEPFIKNLRNYNIPLVFVDYYPPRGSYPVVLIDNISGGFKATSHLILCQHKNIAFIAGDIEHPSMVERFQGYKMALEKNNISFDPNFVVIDEPYTGREDGYSAAKKLLKQTDKISAIFAGNDAMAIGVLQYLKEKKIKVPKEISLIGFDDVESDLSVDPALTTVRVPKVDMGMEVMRVMSAILNNKLQTPRKVLMPVEIVIRNSTCEKNLN
jgi:LacI family transcriptional regulator